MMTQDEQEDWLVKARQTYNSSTDYLNSNLRAQWENNIKMFNNKHPNGSKYNTELYKKRSHIFRPKTRTASTHFDADLSRAFFSTAEHARLVPEDPDDKLAVAGAKVGTDLLSHHLDKTLPWFRLVVGAGQETWKMGNCFSHQGWTYLRNDEGDVVKDQPKITPISSENIRIDEGANWLDPINSSPYLIWVDYMYVGDIKARVGDGENTKVGEWLPVTDDQILAARDFKWDTTNAERQPNQVATKTEPRALEDHDLVPVHKHFTRVNNEDIIFYTLANETMLSEPVSILDEYPTRERPFAMGNLDVAPFQVYHQGKPELAQPIQEEANYVANDRLDNVHLVLNKRYFAKRGRNVDFRSLLRNVAGSITTMDDPIEDVRIVETSDVTQSSYIEQDKIDTDFDDLVGTFSPVIQQAAGQAAGGAVGGMSLAQAGAAGVTEFQLTCFRESWVEPVLRQLTALVLTMESEVTIRKVVRDKEALDVLTNAAIPMEEFLMGLRVNVNVGISATSPQMRVEKLLYAFGALGKVQESPLARKLNMEEISTEIFGQLGYRDGKRFWNQDGGENPEITALKETVAQLENQLQSKTAEIEAKNKLGFAKLEFETGKYQNEQAQRDADVSKTSNEAHKIVVEMEAIYSELQNGSGQELDLAKIQLEYDKLKQQQYEFATSNQTKRDEILVGWKKMREDLDAKLEIVKENNRENDGDQGKDVSNNTATVSENAAEKMSE